jgi:transcriptional regulator of acetoin/glycerol metabolism
MLLTDGVQKEWVERFKADAEIHQEEYHKFLNHLAAVRADWETFMATGRTTAVKYTRREVIDSWKRSRQRRINPYELAPPVTTSAKELAAKLTRNEDFINIASPFLETLLASVNGSQFRIDLLDSEMCVLKQFGEQELLDSSRASGIIVGSLRSEQIVGTNAVGLAALLRKPIQLAGPEHYNTNLHIWTCSAAPLCDQDGNIVGGINMSGHYRKVHMHTLGMVAALAKAIEFSLHQHSLRREKEITSSYLKGIVDSISDGLVAVNENGLVTLINRTALRALELRGEEALEKKADDIFDAKTTMLETVKTGLLIRERELNFYRRGRRKTVFGNCLPIKIDGKIKGGLAVFKDLANTSHLVKNAAGFKAYFHFEDVKGQSSNFKSIVDLARQAASIPSNILLSGESGTGKEVFAQAIHNASPYRDGPFIGINCAAIPVDLIESELFGYEGGSFTGAKREGRPGKMQLAEGGTLFLDEVNSMSGAMQVKLLRVLQNRSFTRIGGLAEIPFRARLIAATNCDLWEQVRFGNFREDLYYRLNVISIDIPPLRFHSEDIPELSDHFCLKLKERLGVDVTISAQALAMLAAYDWPGNVRELENVIERSAVAAISRGSRTIEAADISHYRGLKKTAGGQAESPQFPPYAAMHADSLDNASRMAVENALKRFSGNVSQASQFLGITRKTLYRKMDKYNITAASFFI